MSKRKLYHLILIISVLSTACKTKQSQSPYSTEIVKENTFSLESRKYEFDQIYSPKRIELKNNTLIIIEDKSIPLDFPLIHLVNKQSMTYQSPKGINGYGPLEITDAHLYDAGFNDSTFWVNSTMSKRLTEFSLNDTSRLGINEIKQPTSMHIAYNTLFSSDSTFISLTANDKHRIVEYNFQGQKLSGYGLWEPIQNRGELSNFQLSGVNTGWFKSRADHKFFVKASLYRDRIEVLNYSSKEYIIIDGPRMEIPHFYIAGSGPNAPAIYPQETNYGHRDIFLGYSFIYSLYGGGNYEDYVNTAKIAETIYIINYDGKVTAKLELDRSLRAFVIDEVDNKIYGVTSDENPGIAVFDIPDF